MIELLVLDVDGCLSDGKVIYNSEGIESKNFNVKDGLAIKSWLRMGKKVAILTGRDSVPTEIRAKELGVDYLVQSCKDKLGTLEEILQENSWKLENVAAIGDDLNDYRMLRCVGKAYMPNDGSHFLEEVATKLSKNGGEGVVREMIEQIIEEEGLRDSFLKKWV